MSYHVGEAEGESICLLRCGNDACEVDTYETDETTHNHCPECNRPPAEIVSTEYGTPWRDDD